MIGKDSFFKAHKDTPRGTTMFGSLVIVLPTIHEGGALILRHNDQEWTFDSAKEIGDTKNIGYVTFFSDVEHEVALVKCGSQVKITYNLRILPRRVVLAGSKALPMNESIVKNALTPHLEDDTFHPEASTLGLVLATNTPSKFSSNMSTVSTSSLRTSKEATPY